MNETVVIVAHPDDEIIWCGGLLLRHPDWRWTVLALCRRGDPDREPKFRRVCARLGVRGMLSDLDDGAPLRPIDPAAEIGGRVLAHVGEGTWNLCLTHGRNGEYGHARHRQVSEAVVALVREGRLRCERLWTFAYEVQIPDGDCRPAVWADLTVPLTEVQLAEKRRIVREDYGYPPEGFEVRACISPEAFLRQKNSEEELAP